MTSKDAVKKAQKIEKKMETITPKGGSIGDAVKTMTSSLPGAMSAEVAQPLTTLLGGIEPRIVAKPDQTGVNSVDGLVNTISPLLAIAVSTNEIVAKYKTEITDNGDGEIDITKYKANGKDYCLRLPEFHSFLDLYKFFVRRDYGGSLSQPHPEDPDRNHKWQIHNRYYGLNLINMLCYKSPKTVEFRFLRPSFNWIKLFFWAYFFDMLVTLAESLQAKLANKEFTFIFDFVRKYMDTHTSEQLVNEYTSRESLRNFLLGGIRANQAVVMSQHNVGDYCGERTDIEDVILNRWFEESGINLEK